MLLPPLSWFISVFLMKLPAALPWLLSGLAVVWAASVSPFGQAIQRKLERDREDQDALDRLLNEVAALRAEVGDALLHFENVQRRLPPPQDPPNDSPKAS